MNKKNILCSLIVFLSFSSLSFAALTPEVISKNKEIRAKVLKQTKEVKNLLKRKLFSQESALTQENIDQSNTNIAGDLASIKSIKKAVKKLKIKKDSFDGACRSNIISLGNILRSRLSQPLITDDSRGDLQEKLDANYGLIQSVKTRFTTIPLWMRPYGKAKIGFVAVPLSATTIVLALYTIKFAKDERTKAAALKLLEGLKWSKKQIYFLADEIAKLGPVVKDGAISFGTNSLKVMRVLSSFAKNSFDTVVVPVWTHVIKPPHVRNPALAFCGGCWFNHWRENK
jgi:hypothetical protein